MKVISKHVATYLKAEEKEIIKVASLKCGLSLASFLRLAGLEKARDLNKEVSNS